MLKLLKSLIMQQKRKRKTKSNTFRFALKCNLQGLENNNIAVRLGGNIEG